MKIADKYQFTELFDTCDSYLAQMSIIILQSRFQNKDNSKLEQYEGFLKQIIEGANLVQAPKWTAAIFQARIEKSKGVPYEGSTEKIWSSLLTKNPDFAVLAAKTTKNDYQSWVEQHKSWSLCSCTDKKDKPNGLVFIVGQHGEMKGSVQCVIK